MIYDADILIPASELASEYEDIQDMIDEFAFVTTESEKQAIINNLWELVNAIKQDTV